MRLTKQLIKYLQPLIKAVLEEGEKIPVQPRFFSFQKNKILFPQKIFFRKRLFFGAILIKKTFPKDRHKPCYLKGE
jgi:hypothetical protein